MDLPPGGARRIQARSLQAPEVPPLQLDLYDASLRASCAFHDAADGRLRCLPVNTYVASAYEDAACTRPLLEQVVPEECRSGSEMATLFRGCRAHVYAAAPHRPEGVVYSTGECVSVPAASTLDVDRTFALGEEMPPESFVALEERLAPLSDVFAERFWQADLLGSG